MKFIFVLGIIVLFLVSFVSADFGIGDELYNITTEYSSGEFVKGWINLSFSEENFNSTFVTNTGESVTLFDLLELNRLVSECGFDNCDIDYDAQNPLSTKVVSLIEGESKLIGIKFDKDIIELNSIDFNIRSDVAQSCYNQFKFDVFDDGSIDVLNTNYSKDYCSLFRTKGCFNESHATEEVILSNAPICQRVELPESGGFRLGAELMGGESKSTVTFVIYDLDGIGLGNCPNRSVIGNGEFFCDVDGINSDATEEYYVCVTGNVGDNIKIEYYPTDNGCGFSGIPPKSEDYSYNIIAYSKQFGYVGSFSILDRYSGNYGNFLTDARNYLTSKYGTLECSVKNCVIPIKIYSKVNQQITFENLVGTAIAGGGAISTSTDFYDLTGIPLTYDSGFHKIYLDNASLKVGDTPFSLKLNGAEIFSQDIVVKKVPLIRSLNPLITAAAVTTDFSVNVDLLDAGSSILNYHWDFGNGNSKDTKINEVIYTYNSTGNFDLNVTITSVDKLTSSKSFKIVVETPIKAVDTILNQKLKSLNNLKSQLENFQTFHQNSLKTIFDLTDAEERLTNIKISFDSAVPGVADSYYIGLMQDLLKVVIPNSISVSKSADMLPFYFTENKIDLKALELLGGNYSIGREKDYNKAILSWNIDNLVNTINYKEISADYGDGLEVLLNVFELNINKKPNSVGTPFFVIKKINDLNFEKDYDKREMGDYIFVPLNEDAFKIVFSTTENIGFSELPIFISPQLGNLKISEISTLEDDGISIWIFFSLILFFLILIAIVVYIILQKWYSKKYENYLFKNKNDLYNLILFIENSKKKGIEEKKIVVSLKKAGWNSEQMRYILKKYLGKRTGMFELPVEKILNLFKKKQVVIPQTNISKRRPVRRNIFNPRKFRK
ncbi:MAG: PKD domain-containing protein [Nanoarchaeota archaeon]